MKKVPVRVILGFLTFGMFFMYQLSRSNIYIAIVAITHSELQSNTTSSFDVKAIVLGSFFYMSWITELLGAYLLTKFGCRYVMAITFSFNALACFLFPWSYRLHPLCAVLVRILQGMALGTTWPTLAWLASKWIPKNERSRFMSSFYGAGFGASFGNLSGGFLIEKLGWPSVFYCTGILSIIWVMLWYSYAYDSPASCPRISREELEYLKNNVETNIHIKKVKKPTPWCSIFTSVPFWSIILLFLSVVWFTHTLNMQMPTYFDTVHKLDIRTNGLLLSIPDVMKAVFGIYFPLIIDKFIEKKKITVQQARKLSCGICCMVPGILLVFQAFYGHTSTALSITLVILCFAINGAGGSSIIANIVDISPNYAGTIMGIVKVALNIPGIISPLAVKYILANNNNNWAIIFLITSTLLTSSCTLYIFFTSTDIQPWNSDLEESEENTSLQNIKNGNHKEVETKN